MLKSPEERVALTTDGNTPIDMCGTKSRGRQDKIMEVVDSDVGHYRNTWRASENICKTSGKFRDLRKN